MSFVRATPARDRNMAARLKPRHQDDIRAKIKISNIIDRLEKCIAGEIELSAQQVTSAKILLDKTMSNAPTEIEQKTEHSGTVNIAKVPELSADEWMAAHGLGATARATE